MPRASLFLEAVEEAMAVSPLFDLELDLLCCLCRRVVLKCTASAPAPSAKEKIKIGINGEAVGSLLSCACPLKSFILF